MYLICIQTTEKRLTKKAQTPLFPSICKGIVFTSSLPLRIRRKYALCGLFLKLTNEHLPTLNRLREKSLLLLPGSKRLTLAGSC